MIVLSHTMSVAFGVGPPASSWVPGHALPHRHTAHHREPSIGSCAVELAAGEWKQENRPFATKAGQTAPDHSYAMVTVTAGAGVLAHASVVDNVTNDPTTVRARRVP